jgi:hypothetical protein
MAALLSGSSRLLGVWATEFISLRKEEEFLKWRALEHPEWVKKN